MATAAGKLITVTLVGGPFDGQTAAAHEGQPALGIYEYGPDGNITAVHTYIKDRLGPGDYHYQEPQQ